MRDGAHVLLGMKGVSTRLFFILNFIGTFSWAYFVAYAGKFSGDYLSKIIQASNKEIEPFFIAPIAIIAFGLMWYKYRIIRDTL